METSNVRHPKFVRWALLVGIVAILNIFFTVVLALAYPAPKFEDFCPQKNITPTDAPTCDAQGGVWNAYAPEPAAPNTSALKPYPYPATGYCDMYAKCQKPFQEAGEQHALYAFVLMTVLGILALIAGLIPTGSSIVSSGLSYGGVVALIVGSASYWGTAGNWLRLLIASIGLAALLYIGWKRFRD